MRLVVITTCLAVLVTPAIAAEPFGPGNPTFGEFEAACRIGSGMNPDCRGSVVGAYAEQAKTTPNKVKCDYAAFWHVKDTEYGGRVVSVLPWQYGVLQVVAQPGVCRS